MLLFIGAVGLHSTYQSGLVVAGLALLVYTTCMAPRSVDIAGRPGDMLEV